MTLNLSTLYGTVGPANSDIAAAVAAPSASTIATSVAAAVPTISAINTSVQTYAPSPNAWTLIGSVAANSASAITFSGLSGYKTYRLVGTIASSTGQNIGLQLNGDGGNNYNFSGSAVNSATVSAGTYSAQAAFWFNGYLTFSAVPIMLDVTVECANLAVQKPMKGLVAGGNTTPASSMSITQLGIWKNTATVSSVTLLTTGAWTSSSGTVYLLGGN